MTSKHFARVLGAALGALTFIAAAQAATLEVAVTNVLNAHGRVHVELCPEALFLKDCTIFAEAPAQVGTTIVRIEHLPSGRYAAQAYHDENSNGKVDRGLFGIPLEGVGFSNDAKLRRRGPNFEDAAFDFGGRPGERITLRLRHFF